MLCRALAALQGTSLGKRRVSPVPGSWLPLRRSGGGGEQAGNEATPCSPAPFLLLCWKQWLGGPRACNCGGTL